MYKQVPKLSQPPTFQIITAEAGPTDQIEVQMSYAPKQTIKSIVSMNPELVVSSFTSDTTDVTIKLDWGPDAAAGDKVFQLRVILADGRQYFSDALTCVKNDTCTLNLNYTNDTTGTNYWVSINGTQYTASTTLQFPLGTDINVVYNLNGTAKNLIYCQRQINDGNKLYFHQATETTYAETITLTNDINLNFSVAAWKLRPDISPHNGSTTISGFASLYGASDKEFTVSFAPSTGYVFDKFVFEYKGDILTNPVTGTLGEYVPLGWTGITSSPTKDPESIYYLKADAYGKLATYTVSITQTANQTIKVTTNDGVEHTSTFTANYGTTYTVTVTPATGYNAGTPSVSSGTITGNLTITATAATIKTFQVTITQTANQTIKVKAGSVEYTSTFTANYGTTYTVTVTPATGYNAGTPSVSSGTITGNLTITATAATIKTFTLSIGATTNQTYVATIGGVAKTATSSATNYTVDYGTAYSIVYTANAATAAYTYTASAAVSGTVTADVSVPAKSATSTLRYYNLTVPATTNQTYVLKLAVNSTYGGTLPSYTSTATSAAQNNLSCPYGTTYTITYTGNTGYNGGATKTGTVTAATTVTHNAATIKVLKVIITKPEHGSIYATYEGKNYWGELNVNYGSTVTFTCTPDSGYTLKNWTKNGSVIN
jgi:hypothetical protein